MNEEEFLEGWYRERPIVEAWGKFVAQKLMDQISPLVAPVRADIYIRIPARPRLKQDGSLVTKAFYRDKNYENPLNDITDKVGVRFVVLLAKEISVVCRAIESCEEWEWSKDKDYEAERQKEPYEFRYQSDHYIVRCRGNKDVGGVTVTAGVPCEVQVRTLLQHAHSELTHDTIYKPSVVQTPEMHRAAAKAMALVEATNDYFEELMELIEKSVEPNKESSKQMTILYRELIGVDPDSTKAEGLLNDAYTPFAGENAIESMRQFLGEKPFVLVRIKERAPGKLLFRQPSILLAYFAVSKRPGDACSAWPLTPAEVKPIFTDLGLAAPAS
jgi:ppGpp synthetase/RelA/SpoT-type nucleotidyltranferase